MLGTSQLCALPAVAQTNPGLALKRTSLTTGLATGRPDGGTFSYRTENPTGGTIGTITSTDTVSNPNNIVLPDPANPNGDGSPAQGGFGRYTAIYNINGMSVLNKKDDPFRIPTFGMSCYNSAIESDWGVVGPKTCKSVRIGGINYTGVVTNPDGYKGMFCRSFIAEVTLQGSGETNAGDYIQYNAGQIKKVAAIRGADGTPLVVNMTVARDRSIIPSRGVHVSADGVGDGLLANDTGGAIVGYRLDLFGGYGKAACASFNNVMAISACAPLQTKCSSYAFPTGE